ncbi:MAG4530 family protein [Mycoplasma sp. NEAQ87857]|uniref:MAG4530 family protein n=1 Tax=Mycoplasma sp. NEAQ87857 TaxID=2683967 RepID=UPI003519DB84
MNTLKQIKTWFLVNVIDKKKNVIIFFVIQSLLSFASLFVLLLEANNLVKYYGFIPKSKYIALIVLISICIFLLVILSWKITGNIIFLTKVVKNDQNPFTSLYYAMIYFKYFKVSRRRRINVLNSFLVTEDPILNKVLDNFKNSNYVLQDSYAITISNKWNYRKSNDLDFVAADGDDKIETLLTNSNHTINDKLFFQGTIDNTKVELIKTKYIPNKYIEDKNCLKVVNNTWLFSSKLVQLIQYLNSSTPNKEKCIQLCNDLNLALSLLDHDQKVKLSNTVVDAITSNLSFWFFINKNLDQLNINNNQEILTKFNELFDLNSMLDYSILFKYLSDILKNKEVKYHFDKVAKTLAKRNDIYNTYLSITNKYDLNLINTTLTFENEDQLNDFYKELKIDKTINLENPFITIYPSSNTSVDIRKVLYAIYFTK